MHEEWEIAAHQDFVDAIYSNTQTQILPTQQQVFHACSFHKPADIRVVILGQDPYPTPGDAHGLAFSVEHGKPPRSLVNMFTELNKDYPGPMREQANLSDWAEQGVLLLNTALTVEAGNAGAHLKIGWQAITTTLLEKVAAASDYCVWMLWGAKAQKAAAKLVPDQHLLLQCGHPSPLAYNQKKPGGFKDCGHFKRCNEYLQASNVDAINWL